MLVIIPVILQKDSVRISSKVSRATHNPHTNKNKQQVHNKKKKKKKKKNNKQPKVKNIFGYTKEHVKNEKEKQF